MARKLEFNKAEKHVHNFMMDIQYAKEVRLGMRHPQHTPPSAQESLPLLPETRESRHRPLLLPEP